MAKTSARYRTFGKSLSEARIARGYSQEKAAERIGISWRYYQALEHGFKAPSFETLLKLKKVLRCDWQDLLSGY